MFLCINLTEEFLNLLLHFLFSFLLIFFLLLSSFFSFPSFFFFIYFIYRKMSTWESQLTSQETKYFTQLFQFVSKQQEGIVTGAEAVRFFATSGVPNQILSEVKCQFCEVGWACHGYSSIHCHGNHLDLGSCRS